MTTDAAMPPGGSGRSHAAIALTSAAVLLYQVAITRLLSAVLWYHFAFLAVSLAMLGLGLPGVWYALRPPGPRSLRRALLIAAVAVPLSVVAILQIGRGLPLVAPDASAAESLLHARVLLALGASLVPLLALGSAVCLLLLAAPGRSIGRMYGADLLGATAGAALVVPLLDVVPTPHLLAGIGLLPLAAAWIVCRPWPRSAPVAALGLLALLAWGTPLELHYGKDHPEPEEMVYERWTPVARLTVFEGCPFLPEPDLPFLWGMGTNFQLDRTPRLDQLWLEQDGSAGTPITRLPAGGAAALDHLDYDVTTVGYQAEPPRSVCIVGSGGGRDILSALRAGAERVDAVELNPRIIEAVSERFGEFSGDPYGMPGVRAVASEGRSFLTRTETRYDLIQISLVDSWAATSAGAYALSENYLYTVEAVRLYWDRLTEDGTVSVSRWSGAAHELEALRMMWLAAHVAQSAAAEAPLEHVAVVEAGAVSTILLSRRPWRGARLEALRRVCVQRGFALAWPAVEGPGAPTLARAFRAGRQAYADVGFDVSPPTDERPFFFQMARVFAAADVEAVAELSPNDRGVVLLRLLLGVMGVLTVALFFAPFALAKRLPRPPGFWRGSGYFTAIGLAFMFAEAPWIQRFVLYLGHPSYATTVVLAALLASAGLGSFAAARVRLPTARRYGLAACAVVAAATAVLEPVFDATLGLPFAARAAVSVAVLAPPGFLMGFAFPLGMVAFGERSKAWFWALNGAASVLATAFSLALAMVVGFTPVAYAGAALYAVAWALFPGRAESGE